MNPKILSRAATVGILLSPITACGNTDSTSHANSITVGTTSQFVATQDAPAPMDPAYSWDAASWNYMRNTIQTLMIEADGDGEPIPEAAESCDFTDKESRRYECTLRSGLKFSNGAPIKSADVKYSFDRVRTIKADSGVFALLSTVDNVQTNGDRGVIFNLNTPDATFPYKLTTPVAGIVNRKMYKMNELRNGFSIDGSGPYIMKATVENNTLTDAVFTKNKNYIGNLKLKNETVDIRSFRNSDLMSSAIDKGDIDVMTRTISPDKIDELTKSHAENINILEIPGIGIRYLAFNTDAPQVKDKVVRQAMAQVIDRDELVGKAYGTQVTPLYSLVPAKVTGHTNSFFNKYGDPDVGKAKTLLEDANVTTPVELTLHYTTDHYGPATKTEFKTLQKQLNGSGLFKIHLEGTPWPKYLPASMKGEYDVYGMGWFPDFPDPDNYLSVFFEKDNTLNLPYANDEIRNSLIPQSRREANRTDAVPSLTRIQNIDADDVPLLPLWQDKQYIASRDDIIGSESALNSSGVLQIWQLARGVSG
ncbi:ABC transporter substrate-binding protein [Streptomyces sp. NPDC059215]|uniref:ABC transporter substrate-binding protein n=1 Tax=Streptomyces sp. NPDC059215 TaxID=3346772 RepID=UPI0036AE5FAA